MMKTYLIGLALAVTGSANFAFAEPVGDVDAGQKQFRRCASCHMVGPDAKDRVGPALTSIVGAPIAGSPDFRYSNAFRDAGADGQVWDFAALDAFLANPRGYIRGNRMSFSGIRDAQQRADIIAYLQSFAQGETAGVVDAGFVVAPEILAIEGDVEYGEYLGSECKTCHQTSGATDGIPNIIGLSTDDFATAMHAYREKFRDNPVMQLVANRLDDEEIAALAAYFKDLEN